MTGDAPTTSEWSTILLPTKVWLILEVWRYLLMPWILGISGMARTLTAILLTLSVIQVGAGNPYMWIVITFTTAISNHNIKCKHKFEHFFKMNQNIKKDISWHFSYQQPFKTQSNTQQNEKMWKNCIIAYACTIYYIYIAKCYCLQQHREITHLCSNN